MKKNLTKKKLKLHHSLLCHLTILKLIKTKAKLFIQSMANLKMTYQ